MIHALIVRREHALTLGKPKPWRVVPLVAWLTLAWTAQCGGTTGSSFRPAAAPASERSLRGWLAVRGLDVLASQNSRRLFVPASVLKLVVAAAALHALGPDHRRTTVVAAAGPLVDGVLKGDLVLRGAADPTWNARFHPADPREPLKQLARQVRDAGIRRVTGNLVVDASRFPGPSQSLNHTLVERSLWYGAPCSAAAVDENVFPLRMAAGLRVGAPGRLSTDIPLFDLANRIVTVSPGRKGSVEMYPGLDGRTLVARGDYPMDEPPYTVKASVPDPDLYAGEVFLQILRESGVGIAGQVRVVHAAPREASAKPVGRIQSPPLSEILPVILGESHNWYAEMLLRILAFEARGEGRPDLGLEVERTFLREEVGIPDGAFFLDDASGLSPDNLLAPEAVVALLEYALRQPWREVFVSALAAPGQGTLRHWPPLPKVRGKSGTLQQTVALAGYLDPSARNPIAFAVFVNHWLDQRYDARTDIAGLLRTWAR
jgi:serine-type D-Ala-D-Ala carboxypeptidase/endopeptidase (penicillin-binding protein 4)